MAKLKLSREDTDFMRDYIHEGVNLKETAEQIKARRKELAALFNCTISQVTGAVAWKKGKNGDDLVLIPLKLQEGESVPSNVSASEQETQTPQVIEKVEVSPIEEEKEPEVPGNDTPTEVSNNVRYHPKGGAWADYEHSAIKEVWREKEAEFIDRNVDKDPAARANMRVLCTPGIKCHLEVRHLLKLGFKPENITAIECESKAWEGFEANAKELGIQPHFGKLIDLLPEINAPFDIACVDFVNPGSFENLMTTEYIPLAPKAVVAINVMAKRETVEFQEEMGRLHKTTVPPVDGVTVGQRHMREELEKMKKESRGLDISRIIEATSNAYDKLEEHFSNDNDLSWDERDTMLWYMQRYAGTGRVESGLFPNMVKNLPVNASHFKDKDLSKVPPDRLQSGYASYAFKTLGQFLQQIYIPLLAFSNDPRFTKAHMVMDLLNCVSRDRRQIVALEKYRYNSMIGKTPSPFYTSLAVTEVPKREYRAYGPLLFFALKFAEALAKNDDGMPIEPSTNFYDSVYDQRLLITNGKKKSASISHGELLSMLDDYLINFVPKYPLSLHSNQKEIPWARLEDIMEQESKDAG